MNSRTLMKHSIAGSTFLLFAFGTLSLVRAQSKPPPPAFVKLESIRSGEVCGQTVDDKTACFQYRSGAPTFVAEGVGKLTDLYSNAYAQCGRDEEGVKCWNLNTSPVMKGKTAGERHREIFEKADGGRISLSEVTACSVFRDTGELNCVMPYWSGGDTLNIPGTKVRAFYAFSSVICWSDNTRIVCRGNRTPPVNEVAFADATELLVASDFLCARSQTEAKCWISKDKSSVMPASLVTSGKWQTVSSALCALIDDTSATTGVSGKRIACFEPRTGAERTYFPYSNLPKEYSEPNPDLVQLWFNNAGACVLEKNSKTFCWRWYSGTPKEVVFSEPVKQLFGTSNLCAITTGGRAECRNQHSGALLSRPLKKGDRVRVVLDAYNSAPTYWNSGGISMTTSYYSVPSFKRITDVKFLGNEYCVIGVREESPSYVDEVVCFNYYGDYISPPHKLTDPYDASTYNGASCALSADGLTCWGQKYAGEPPPARVSGAQKLQMRASHACVLDTFGMLCWGDYKRYGLQVPTEYDQPGRIVDFALGDRSTCAILDDGRVGCWGVYAPKVPDLYNVESIIAFERTYCAIADGNLRCWGAVPY